MAGGRRRSKAGDGVIEFVVDELDYILLEECEGRVVGTGH
jgi:hypothetical protein